MKKLITVIALLALVGCGSEQVLLQGLDGAPGLNGTDGAPGANGADGQDGLNSLCSIGRISSEQEVCQSGGGLLLTCGLDADRDNTLDAEEVNEASVGFVCDGAPGPQGPQGEIGPAGADGEDGADGADGEDGENGATGEQGPQGPAGDGASLSVYQLTTSCQSVGSGLYAKMFGSTAKIYDDNDCGTSDKVADLTDSSDEVFMTSSLMLIIEGSKLYKILF